VEHDLARTLDVVSVRRNASAGPKPRRGNSAARVECELSERIAVEDRAQVIARRGLLTIILSVPSSKAPVSSVRRPAAAKSGFPSPPDVFLGFHTHIAGVSPRGSGMRSPTSDDRSHDLGERSPDFFIVSPDFFHPRSGRAHSDGRRISDLARRTHLESVRTHRKSGRTLSKRGGSSRTHDGAPAGFVGGTRSYAKSEQATHFSVNARLLAPEV
jgi:hypothetical protein